MEIIDNEIIYDLFRSRGMIYNDEDINDDAREISQYYETTRMDDPNITMEEYIRIEEEKARRHVFNDTLTSEAPLSYEPTVSSLNNDEIDFRISFNEFDDDDYMIVFDKNSFSYKVISANDFKTDSENDNDKVNMPLLPSPEPTITIVYNDAPMSKSDSLTESILSPLHIDEFNLKDETSLSEYDEDEQNVICFNDLFPFNDLKKEISMKLVECIFSRILCMIVVRMEFRRISISSACRRTYCNHTIEDDLEVFSTDDLGLDWIYVHNFLTCLQQLSSYTSGHYKVSESAACLEKLHFPTLMVMSKFSRICFSFVILEVSLSEYFDFDMNYALNFLCSI
ncbi:hypothetical protein Tco_0139049 [Tanacetum coccineum]